MPNATIANMLAQSGANIGQAIGSPVAQIGRDIGGMLTARSERKAQDAQDQQVQKELQEYASDPAQLNAMGQKYQSMGKPDVAKAFYEAAKRATATQTGNVMSTAIGAKDPAVLIEQAQAMAKIPGMQEQALQLLTMANEMKQKLANTAALTERKTDVALQAEEMGFPELAKQVRSSSSLERVNSIGDTLTERKMETMPELSVPARRKILLGKGYTPQFVGKLDLKNMSKQEFNAYSDLQKGDVEMFLQDGQPVTYRVTDSGMVAVDGKLVDPSTLNLTEAPNQQVIKNVTSGMAGELSKLGAESFAEGYTQAKKSADSIQSIDNIIGDVDTMFTGSLANVNLQVNKFLKAVGYPVDSVPIENTEAFLAESAKRVADYITNLGAGTGLSDKDLAFTTKVVAGDITLDDTTIKRMLEEFRREAARKIEKYNNMRTNVSSKLGEDNQAALAFYDPVFVPTSNRFEGFEIVTESE
jgi:hypothetical protein